MFLVHDRKPGSINSFIFPIFIPVSIVWQNRASFKLITVGTVVRGPRKQVLYPSQLPTVLVRRQISVQEIEGFNLMSKVPPPVRF